MSATNPSVQSVAEFNITGVPNGRDEIARRIVKAFADAGFGKPQQLAALANAIAESNLDPAAMSSPPEQGVGLFQLNEAAGLGKGHTGEELEDPTTNIDIILSAASKSDEFAKAVSLEDAISAFVRTIMRPRDPAGEVVRRLKIAERLAQTS